MKLTKLNFVGEAAESKEFRNAQLVKGAKVVMDLMTWKFQSADTTSSE